MPRVKVKRWHSRIEIWRPDLVRAPNLLGEAMALWKVSRAGAAAILLKKEGFVAKK